VGWVGGRRSTAGGLGGRRERERERLPNPTQPNPTLWRRGSHGPPLWRGCLSASYYFSDISNCNANADFASATRYLFAQLQAWITVTNLFISAHKNFMEAGLEFRHMGRRW
jgi:hypothetical protein